MQLAVHVRLDRSDITALRSLYDVVVYPARALAPTEDECRRIRYLAEQMDRQYTRAYTRIIP